MKISARNTLPGVISRIDPGAVNTEVTLEIAPGVTVVSIEQRMGLHTADP